MEANVYKNIEKCFELMSSYLLLRLTDSLIKAICPALNEIIKIEEYLKVRLKFLLVFLNFTGQFL